jgi:cytoskeleton protein RodZ
MKDNDTDGREEFGTDRESDMIRNTDGPETVGEAVNQDDRSLPCASEEISIPPSQITEDDRLADISTKSAANTEITPGFGQILHDERIKRGLSVGEVARRLRLSEQQVEAIEAQDFAKLPAVTFLRGYVRNYANLLQLEGVNRLLESLPRSTPAHTYSNEYLSQRFKSIEPVSRRNRSSRGLLYFAVILVAVFAAYGLYQHGGLEQESSYSLDSFDVTALSDPETGNDQAAVDLPLPLSPSSSLELPFSPPTVGNNIPLTSGTAVLPDPSISSESTPDMTEDSGDGKKSLHFSFSRDSWVKVKDGDGKVILEKTHSRGTEQMVQGKPPLYLVIGNAPGVNLTYNGRTVDLVPYTRGSDDVARFSLE